MAKELLKDSAIKSAKPDIKDKRLNDGDGLYLLIKPSGARWWRFDYSIDSKRKTLSLGTYPDTSLADARRKAEEARKLAANGIDPSDTRKAVKKARHEATENEKRIKAGLPIVGSFEDIAGQWFRSIKHQIAEQTYNIKLSRFRTYVFPVIGGMDIKAVKSPDIMAVIKTIDSGKTATAKALRAEISAVFGYAIAHGLADYDVAQPVAKMLKSHQGNHRPALTNPADVGRLLRDIDAYNGTFTVKSALRLLPVLFCRPGELRLMEWAGIDIEAKEWRYLASKTGINHIVPLSSQAIKILTELRPVTGHSEYVFPKGSDYTKPMSKRTIQNALQIMGYDDIHCAHGFRTTASTLLNEQGWSPDAIERQLCHMPKDAVRAAYNRAQYLEERRKMMQAWADYLDSLKSGADVIPIGKRA
ncbi:integrase arm-type DNA-binding domain-containing protein [Methylobacter sp. BBA5.1]|jgi:integrase|uniref:tyrosine-type recombinase/integrase n=1 Tax=Methylobacter sp. BBA5.1 TaxID=1495064 RepID=UPI000565AAE6|nr:integrase arm-type DNA-binding domain-containing protein [Methylobacter sp. BBA5.1]